MLLLSNRIPIRTGSQFGFLGHGTDYSKSQRSWASESGHSYISLTYTGAVSIPRASKITAKLLSNRSGVVSDVEIYLDEEEISSQFDVEIVGTNYPLSSVEPTSLYIYTGSWYEKDGQNRLLGQTVDGINYGQESDLPTEKTPEELNGSMVSLPATAGSSGTGSSPTGGQFSVTSIFAIIECDGLIYLCDIAELVNSSEQWTIEEGSNDNDLLVDYLESIICDFEPEPCDLDFEILTESTPFNCYGNSYPISIFPRGGTPPYQITVKGHRGIPIMGGSRQTITGLSVNITESGDYTICITDNAGCTIEETVTYVIPEPLGLNIEEDQDICEGDDATVVAVATEGVPPYDYLWSTGEEDKTVTFTNVLEDKTVFCTVTDDYECSKVDSVVINVIDPPSLILSWDPCDNRFYLEESDNEFCGEAILERFIEK